MVQGWTVVASHSVYLSSNSAFFLRLSPPLPLPPPPLPPSPPHLTSYEINTEGDAFHVAFKDVQHAVLFCMEVQYQVGTWGQRYTELVPPVQAPKSRCAAIGCKVARLCRSPFHSENPGC